MTEQQLQALVDELFTNGDGTQAHRLVLTSMDGRDLGGWCRQAVVDRIRAAVRAGAALPPQLERKELQRGTRERPCYNCGPQVINDKVLCDFCAERWHFVNGRMTWRLSVDRDQPAAALPLQGETTK